MGQKYSTPRPGTKLRVIGAGLPRTGTASFSQALEILLDGPVYHGGTQVTLGPETDIKTWIEILSQWPPRNDAINQANLDLLRSRLDGYAAITDSPGSALIPELLALYPDAKVVCTTRDVDSWVKSMAVVASASTQWFLRFILFPLPSLRFFVDYIDGLRDQWLFLYGETEPPTRKTYDRHVEWLKEVVPREQLIFYDVKDGWEPLCKALNLPVPENQAFPRINDGKAIDDFSKKQIMRGLRRWILVLVATTVLAALIKALLS